jgi:hypothetical protein
VVFDAFENLLRYACWYNSAEGSDNSSTGNCTKSKYEYDDEMWNFLE